MSGAAQRRRREVDALVALLSNLAPGQLDAILERLGVRAAEPRQDRPRRPCQVCGWQYAKCRSLAAATGDDHDFEAPA